MDKEQSREPTTQSGRPVRLTEVGKGYQKEMKMKSFNRQFKELKRHTEKIIGDGGTIIPDTGKLELKEWTHAYVNLLQTLSDLRGLLTPDELDLLEKDTGPFHAQNTQIQEALDKLRSAESRAPSVVSRSSRTSLASVRASLKILQIQDAHQKVALRAKQSALQKRREIEKEKQAIKWKEEDLDLEVELATAEEQGKTLQKFETELEVGVPVQAEQAQADKIASTANVAVTSEPPQATPARSALAPVGAAEAPDEISPQGVAVSTGVAQASASTSGLHHRGLNVDAHCFLPGNVAQEQQQQTVQDSHTKCGPSELSALFAEQRRAQLPALEPEVFQGSVEKVSPLDQGLREFHRE